MAKERREARERQKRAKLESAKQTRMQNPSGDSAYAAKVKAGRPRSPIKQAEELATQPRPYSPPNIPVTETGFGARFVFRRTKLPSGTIAVVGIAGRQVVFA